MWISNAARACGNSCSGTNALAGVRVVEHGVAVAERAALDVLAGQPDRHAVGEDAGKRQLLGRRPVDRPLGRVGERGLRRSRPRSSFLWNVKPSGVASSASLISRSRSSGTPVCVLRGRARRAGSGIGGTKSSSGFSDANACSSTVKCFFTRPSTASGGTVPLLDERSREQLAHGRVRADLLVHQRLRERRLVAFVVPVTPVADQVDQEVAPEARAVLPRQPRGLEAGGRIVGVDVDDRES